MYKQIFTFVALLILMPAPGTAQSGSVSEDKRYEEKLSLEQLETGIILARLGPRGMVGRKLLGAIIPDLKDVLSDDYTRIDSQGQLINREQELERLKDTGVSPASYFKIIEKQAQVYGNIGFVKSVLEIDNPYKTDYPSGKYRVLNIYLKRDNKWMLNTSQWTVIQE